MPYSRLKERILTSHVFWRLYVQKDIPETSMVAKQASPLSQPDWIINLCASKNKKSTSLYAFTGNTTGEKASS